MNGITKPLPLAYSAAGLAQVGLLKHGSWIFQPGGKALRNMKTTQVPPG
ncbi:hypothetical protein [Paracoccus actinidiae]|nr:hypothetical protein [Paracoccus sp. M09]